MSNVEIRFAKEEELEQVNKIRRQVNDLHAAGRPDIFRQDGWEFIAPFVYTRFREEESGIIVALDGNEVVGFATVQFMHTEKTPYKCERHFYHVEEFGVDENHRRGGIATSLMNFMKKDAQERGFDKLELDMWEFNEDALLFYESVGFKTVRRYMEMDAKKGEKE